jgi:predicted O-methyltransferase YrrM
MDHLERLFQKIVRGSTPSSPQQAIPAPVEVHDVTPFAAEIDLAALEVVRWAPVWMSRAERLLLFSLIFGLRPKRFLEIGTFQGGSALVVAAAMDASDTDGRLVCVDPELRIAPEHWARIEHRTILLEEPSPDALPRAFQVAGGPFDFVLIDGDHSYAGVMRDANGVLPYLADGAYLLFHDSFFPEIGRALDDFAAQHAQQIADFGTLTREVTVQPGPQGEPIRWGGLRLMQVRRGTGTV